MYVKLFCELWGTYASFYLLVYKEQKLQGHS